MQFPVLDPQEFQIVQFLKYHYDVCLYNFNPPSIILPTLYSSLQSFIHKDFPVTILPNFETSFRMSNRKLVPTGILNYY